MNTRTQKIMEAKVRKMVRKRLAEYLIKGFGFSKDDVYKMNLLRHEASINKKDDFEPPVKGKGKDKTSAELDMPDMPSFDRSCYPSHCPAGNALNFFFSVEPWHDQHVG